MYANQDLKRNALTYFSGCFVRPLPRNRLAPFGNPSPGKYFGCNI